MLIFKIGRGKSMDKIIEDINFEEVYKSSMRLQEMAFVVRKQDNRKFLLEVRTKEKPHENSYPHAHIYNSDK